MADVNPDSQQDPLPEGSFFYRRIFSAVTVLLLLGAQFVIVWRMTAALLEVVKGDSDATAIAEALRDQSFYGYCVLALICTYYLLAPSGEQLALIVQSAKIAIAKIPDFPGRSRPAPPRDDEDERDYAPRSRRR